jgi:ribose-phosphate pyrophosphokinase
MVKIFSANKHIPHEKFIFSGGEVQVKISDSLIKWPTFFIIKAHLTNSNDFFELALVVDALRRMYGSHVELYLILPYLPYARQDRAMTTGESLSLKVFCGMINNMNFESVEVWDVHSDVSLALLDRVSHKPVEKILGNYVRGNILVAPDAGSLKKVAKVAQTFSVPMVRADKTRSVVDGSITGTVVYSENVGDKDFLIVDDICDGGRTFIELAKELRKLTTGKIKLYVTHGIFSKGLAVFNGLIDVVYCAVPFPGTVPDVEYDGEFYVVGNLW